LRALCTSASARGVRVLIGLAADVSAARAHRKHSGRTLIALDEASGALSAVTSNVLPRAGSTALSSVEPSRLLLNFRDVRVWRQLAADASSLLFKVGAHGVYLPAAMAAPPLLPADCAQLERADPDGNHHDMT
jgi:hypothetical protein